MPPPEPRLPPRKRKDGSRAGGKDPGRHGSGGSKANEVAGKAEHAVFGVESTTISAMKGATVRFSGFVDQGYDRNIECNTSG